MDVFCVNALSRAHFISTEKVRNGENAFFVSMPYLGRTSFLLIGHAEKIGHVGVSMPYLGRTSFLQFKSIEDEKKIGGVNALSRAHFISTRESLL